MKIIKRGKNPDDTLIGTCSKCGCVVECRKSETTSIGKYTEHYDAVACPTCSRSKLLPTWIKMVREVRP